MFWLLRRIFKLAVFLIILSLIVGVVLILFISPNKFKDQISTTFESYLGHPVQISGPISWKIRPDAMLSLQQLSILKSAQDPTPILQVQDVTIYFDLFSLMSNKLVVNDLQINNISFGYDVLKDLISKSSSNARRFIVQSLKVKNAEIEIQDPSNKLNLRLQNTSFSTNSLIINANQDIPPISLQGQLLNLDHNTTCAVNTVVKINREKNSIALAPLNIDWNNTPLQGTATIEQYNSVPIINGNLSLAAIDVGMLLKKLDPYFTNNNVPVSHSLQMNMNYSYAPKDQILDVSKLNLQVEQGSLEGDLKIMVAAPYQTEFNLTAKNLDFNPIFLLGSAVFPSVHTMTTIPTELLSNLIIKGKFSGNKISFTPDLVAEQLNLEINGQQGIVQVAPIIMNAYNGQHNLSLNIDVINKQQPFFTFTEQANNVDIAPWIKLLNNGVDLIKGSANIKMSLEAMGNDINTLRQTITGGVNLHVNDGTLQGFDVTKLMQFATQTATDIFNALSSSATSNLNNLAVTRSSDWIQTQQNKPVTKFSRCELKADINLGVTTKASIAMNNNLIDLKGDGKFSVIDGSINFDTKITTKTDISSDIKDLINRAQQSPLSMTISGTIGKPMYGPNVQGYVMNVINLTKEDLTNIAITKMVSVTPPNVKTDKTASELFFASVKSLNK